METNKTPLERAFELADSGQYGNVADIKSQLGKERLNIDQVTGPSLMAQLRLRIKAAFGIQAR